ncbi:hypothetical protein SEA_CECE_228 [Microbacterium phage Cece]|nr:hypothetical protein SEA_CECE_228 [Microbacterium phage Cece]
MTTEPEAEDRRTPDEWCAHYGIEVMDHDGWDRSNLDEDWAIPLTKDEFSAKIGVSTVTHLRRDDV